MDPVKAGDMGPALEGGLASGKEKKLLEQMRDIMRLKHYRYRTEQTYFDWGERFIRSRLCGIRGRWASRGEWENASWKLALLSWDRALKSARSRGVSGQWRKVSPNEET